MQIMSFIKKYSGIKSQRWRTGRRRDRGDGEAYSLGNRDGCPFSLWIDVGNLGF